ncbi:hypothetical protein MNV49_006077 [Pseudohyphozyma bogoriensis]|nr:hypothetical protein MNV49_006077 [Pseudohyphozyma bogoriensis]
MLSRGRPLVRSQLAQLTRRGLATTAAGTASPAATASPHEQLRATSTAPVFFDRVSIPGYEHLERIPAFRVLDGEGHKLDGVTGEWADQLDAIPDEVLTRVYRKMVLLPALDTILSSSQRQGRISFYMTSYGEEGTVVGSAAAFEPTDEVFAQYREVGVLLYRDYPLSSIMSQVFSTVTDTATRGRQMPVHFGSDHHHFHTISSPLATQIPQAAGAAYALKRTPGREKGCVVCYMGEGAASEGDFHAGVNMASVLGGPLVFIARNNGSDDSSAYRSASAVESIKKFDSPIFRLRKYLESRPTPLWSSELEESTKASDRKEIMTAFSKAEKQKKPSLDSMWEDTFAEMERPQREQRAELKRLVEKWGVAWEKELEKFEGGKKAFLEAP